MLCRLVTKAVEGHCLWQFSKAQVIFSRNFSCSPALTEPVDDLSPVLDLQMGATWRLAVVDFGVARVEPDDLALFLCFLSRMDRIAIQYSS